MPTSRLQLLRIVQEVGSQLNLQDVCICLIRRFQEVVACRRMAMLIFLENKKNVFAVSESGRVLLEQSFFDSASLAFGRLDETTISQTRWSGDAACHRGFRLG